MENLVFNFAAVPTSPGDHHEVPHVPLNPNQVRIGRVDRLFSMVYEPITRREILTNNPELFDIYAENRQPLSTIRILLPPPEDAIGGAALKSIYQLEGDPSAWLGKICGAEDRLGSNENSANLLIEANLSAIFEKRAYDIYKEWGRGLFTVPGSFLSKQPMKDAYTKKDPRVRSGECLRIFCRLMNEDEYQDFKKASTLTSEGEKISFVDFIQKYHRPPETILGPEGTCVPLCGIMELLAVMRAIGDIDGLGTGGNAGFAFGQDENGRTIAKTVKIDPGAAFLIREQDIENAVMKTQLGLGSARYRLSDCRDIQTARQDDGKMLMTIRWRMLTPRQQETFLSTLMNCLRYKYNDNVLDLLIFRDGRFNRTRDIPDRVMADQAQELKDRLIKWLDLQEKIYKVDLERFQENYPEELLRIQYIDRYGVIPSPATNDAHPISEIYANLTLVDKKESKKKEPSQTDQRQNTNLPERDSLYDLFTPPQWENSIELPSLFNPKEQRAQKVLLIGTAGVGKSTICQMIAHDWAKKSLWAEYKAIYWLPLRKCNSEKFHTPNPHTWLIEALTRLVVERPFLEESLKKQLKENTKEILIVLDGYDEASPAVRRRVEELINPKRLDLNPKDLEILKNLNILLTSRPGAFQGTLDRTVETRGFSQVQSREYARRFFERTESSPLHATEQFNAFQQALEKNSLCSKISGIPLQLQMLCALWPKIFRQEGLPSTLTGLYQVMVEELFHWHCQRNQMDQDFRAQQEPLFILLGKIGYEGLKDNQLLIEKDIVKQALKGSRLTESQLLVTGLLKKNDEGDYYFIHKSFQEYLTALYVRSRPSQDQKKFVIDNRHRPQYQLVLAFLSGLLASQGNTPEARNFFRRLQHTSEGDANKFYPYELTLCCLNEWVGHPDLYIWVNGEYRLEETFLSEADRLLEESQNYSFMYFADDLDPPILPIRPLLKRYPNACQKINNVTREHLQDLVCCNQNRKASQLLMHLTSTEQIPETLRFLISKLKDYNHEYSRVLLLRATPKQVLDFLETSAIQVLTAGFRRELIDTLGEIGLLLTEAEFAAAYNLLEECCQHQEERLKEDASEALERIKKAPKEPNLRFIQAFLKDPGVFEHEDPISWIVQRVQDHLAFRNLFMMPKEELTRQIFSMLMEGICSSSGMQRTFRQLMRSAAVEHISMIISIFSKWERDGSVEEEDLEALGEMAKIAKEEDVNKIIWILEDMVWDHGEVALGEETSANSDYAINALSSVVPYASAKQISRIIGVFQDMENQFAMLLVSNVCGLFSAIANSNQFTESHFSKITKILLSVLMDCQGCDWGDQIFDDIGECLGEFVEKGSEEQISKIISQMPEKSNSHRGHIMALEGVARAQNATKAQIRKTIEILKPHEFSEDGEIAKEASCVLSLLRKRRISKA